MTDKIEQILQDAENIWWDFLHMSDGEFASKYKTNIKLGAGGQVLEVWREFRKRTESLSNNKGE